MPDVRMNRQLSQAAFLTISDFKTSSAGTASGLHPAEEKLLDAARTGTRCLLAGTRPSEKGGDNFIRSAFLRFLALGGSEDAVVHEKGVQVEGAFIDDRIDLDYAGHIKPLRLTKCWIDGRFSARNAHFIDLTLDGTRCQGGDFDDAQFAGTVSMRDGFLSEGGLRFTGANIQGDLDLYGAILKNPGVDALACRRVHVRRSVYLTGGFVAIGRVRFSGAEIGGDFNAYGGRFVHLKASSLPEARSKPRAGHALSITNAVIDGVLWLSPWQPPFDQHVRIEGSLDLQGTRVATLADHQDSWPVRSIQTPQGVLPCVVQLDGFIYERLGASAPIDADLRRRWLLQQEPRRRSGAFRPQPFEQLIKVLRSMGHDHEARQIGLLKESLTRPMNIRATSPLSRPFAIMTDHLYGFFSGYGYRPHRLFFTIFLMWSLSAWFFSVAERQGGFAPRDAEIWTNDELIKKCADERWTACADVFNLIPFNAASYAADTIIPVIDLQQRSNWAPMLKTIDVSVPYVGRRTLPAGTLHVVAWCVNIFGALAVILLGAIASGLIKKD